jgi:hypothetical protein
MSTYIIIFGVQFYLLRYLILWTCGFWFAYTRNKEYLPHIYICWRQNCNCIWNQFYSFQITNTESLLVTFCFSMSYIITYFLCLVKGQAIELVLMRFHSIHGVPTTPIRTLWAKYKDFSMLKQVTLNVISVLQTVKCTKEFTFIWHNAK